FDLTKGSVGKEILADTFYNVDPNTTYTASMIVKTDGKISYCEVSYFRVTHNLTVASLRKINDNTYLIFGTNTTRNDDTQIRFPDFRNLTISSGTYLKLGKYKLERGNIPTDWSPAPEDYWTRIAALEEKVKRLEVKP
ncbi:hypothetical protein QP202_24525, partial [Escherichia coli]|nr:hypothetical protein [Escherichia coli]